MNYDQATVFLGLCPELASPVPTGRPADEGRWARPVDVSLPEPTCYVQERGADG